MMEPSGRPRRSSAHLAEHHPVAVQHFMHFTLADKQVGAAAVVRLDKTKAVLVADDAPGFQVELIDHAHRALCG